MSKPVVMKAWADVGSHGRPFVFMAGPVAQRYPELLHVYNRQVTPDLMPCHVVVYLDGKRAALKVKKDGTLTIRHASTRRP